MSQLKAKIEKNEIKPDQRELLNSMFGNILEEKGIDKNNYNLIFENGFRPEILYHYTSLEVLYSILENVDTKEVKNEINAESDSFLILRGTDITYLNDFSEFELVPGMLAKAIKDIEDNLEPSEKKNLSSIITSSYLKEIANFFGMFTVHVSSFSENSDNLPMWSTYGQEGKGVAIGFDFSKIIEWLQSIDIDRPMLIKCSYNHEQYKEPIQEMANEIYQKFSRKGDRISVSGIPKFEFLAEYFSSLKNFAYEYENEWRLIKVASESDNILKKCQMKNGIIKPYIEHNIPLDALKEIVVGPCSNIELIHKSIEFSRNRVRSKTRKSNFDFVIKNSKIPYRLI